MSDDATDTPQPPKRFRISNQAFLVFEEMFHGWLDDHQEELSFGGDGDVKELSWLCARWAAEYLKD